MQTQVQKIDGDPTVLRDELKVKFGLEGKGEAIVKPSNGHVVVKGFWKEQVVKHLRERMF